MRFVANQALLLLDGDDVVKLLKLPAGARRDIEAAARRHGPVVRCLVLAVLCVGRAYYLSRKNEQQQYEFHHVARVV